MSEIIKKPENIVAEQETEQTPQSYSNTQQPISPSDNRYRWFGFIVLIVTFGFLGVWAATAPIDDAALAQGYVSVKHNSKTVQHLHGGIVKELHVREGDSVKVDDILIELDDTQVRAERNTSMGHFFSLLAQESRLLAEQTDSNSVKYPEELSESDDLRASQAIVVQNQIFETRTESLSGEVQVLEQRIAQLAERKQGMLSQKNSSETLAASLKEEIAELRDLLKEGFAEKQRLRERERQLAEAQGTIGELTAEIAAVDVQIGETRLEIIQLQKERREEIANTLSEVQSKLYDVREQLKTQEDRLARTEIKSPATGEVLGLQVHTNGGVVRAGEPIMDIVPEGEELTIVAKVNPKDIDRVKAGQKAEVRFSAFQYGTTPRLFANVVKVSADRIVEENSDEVYYEARLEVDNESLLELNNLVIMPGMPAEVLIKSGERTLIEYLGKPISDAFSRAFLEE